ncbi:cysteine desulfurase family protein [Galbitalea sp. SE-J8]|uniref:cysteine desulfurase family protein n=1 Tax=Galbitalea sp. SE-J8 TaxID=3054952 RepID=UPI00259C8019|nr:cysteine desulfurase family protein [Galbitalea sp. SE-J8]MDM4761850.1 cysteine desulfurase family protein [Galbitalea sp. SE-J8]
MTVYLDHAATTPVRREVLEAMWPWLTSGFGNPSSHHEVGRQAADAVVAARAAVASTLGARPSEIVFTAGGTEGDNLAIKGMALANPRGRHLVTAATEHEAVLESCDYLARLHGFEVSFVPLTPEGIVTPDALRSVLRADTTLVTLAHGNNEIGVVQDIEALAAVAHGAGALVHTDAVQSAGWLDVGLAHLGVDAVSIAGHKLGAPKGIGAVAIRASVPVEPVLHGGGQERGRRSGTENVAGAVGLATALELASALRAAAPAVAARRDALIDGVLARVPSARLTGPPGAGPAGAAGSSGGRAGASGTRHGRLPNHASFCFPGTSGEGVLLELERHGIVSSSGSACAAGSDEPSHVLLAIGIAHETAQTSVRFTLDSSTTDDDIRFTVERVAEAVAALSALGR